MTTVTAVGRGPVHTESDKAFELERLTSLLDTVGLGGLEYSVVEHNPAYVTLKSEGVQATLVLRQNMLAINEYVFARVKSSGVRELANRVPADLVSSQVLAAADRLEVAENAQRGKAEADIVILRAALEALPEGASRATRHSLLNDTSSCENALASL